MHRLARGPLSRSGSRSPARPRPREPV